MSTHKQKPNRSKRRRAAQLHALDEQPLPTHKPPSAYDAILAWLLWLPSDADPRHEALHELERIDARGELPEEANELRKFLVEISTGDSTMTR